MLKKDGWTYPSNEPSFSNANTEWAAAASEARDIERILSYWTEDAVVLPPGLPPVIGKAALRDFVQASMQIPGFQISWTLTDVTFSRDRNLAYMFGQNAVTMNGPAPQDNSSLRSTGLHSANSVLGHAKPIVRMHY